MPKYQQGDEQISDGVNLLISILVRYPEIGTVTFDPKIHCLKLNFILSGMPPESDFNKIKKLLLDSITLYHILENLEKSNTDIFLNAYDQFAMLTIVRDVHTLSKGEITLIIALLRENLKDFLVTDPNDTLPEEDLLIQEEVIENMLENMKRTHADHSIIGIREDGRVLVFNK